MRSNFFLAEYLMKLKETATNVNDPAFQLCPGSRIALRDRKYCNQILHTVLLALQVFLSTFILGIAECLLTVFAM